MSSSSFLVWSLGFSMYSIMSSASSDSFTSFFQFGFLWFLFLLWLPWLGLPKYVEQKVVSIDILVLFLIFRGNVFSFSVLRMMFIVGLSYTAFNYVEVCSFNKGASLVAQLVKNLPAMWETWVWSLGWGSPGEGNSYPLQYSGLENSIDCIVHGVTKGRTRTSDFPFYFHLFLLCPLSGGLFFFF